MSTVGRQCSQLAGLYRDFLISRIFLRVSIPDRNLARVVEPALESPTFNPRRMWYHLLTITVTSFIFRVSFYQNFLL